MSKVLRWVSHAELDSTNNLVERFNLHLKAVLFKGHTFNKGSKAIEIVGDLFRIQEIQSLSEDPAEDKVLFSFWWLIYIDSNIGGSKCG